VPELVDLFENNPKLREVRASRVLLDGHHDVSTFVLGDEWLRRHTPIIRSVFIDA
jgi:hypothetical protein